MGTNYYLQTKPCRTCGNVKTSMHIGKQSYGWPFLFQAHHEGPCSYDDWVKELSNGKKIIRNEYDEVVSLENLLKMIKEAKNKPTHYRQEDEEWVRKNYFADKKGYRFTYLEFL